MEVGELSVGVESDDELLELLVVSLLLLEDELVVGELDGSGLEVLVRRSSHRQHPPKKQKSACRCRKERLTRR